MTDGNRQDPNQPQSTNTAKWVALGCGGCLGLIVLFAVVVGIFASRVLQFAIGPDNVEEQGQELFTYSLPGGSEGIVSIDLFGLQITQVATPDNPASAVLTIGKVPAYLEEGASEEAFADTLQEQVTLEGTYNLLEQRTEARTLCGQPINLLVQEGRFEDEAVRSEAASYFAVVDHNNQTRFAWILAQGDQPLQIADQVFDSLECQ